MPTCPACNYQLSQGATMCPGCGAALSGPAAREDDSAETWHSMPDEPHPLSRRRPVWVWIIFGLYVLLAGTITFGPLLAALVGGTLGGLGAALISAFVIVLCGGSLLIIPIRAAHDLPNTQRSIWLPLICSATLATAVFGGFAVAAHEFTFGGQGDKTGEDAMSWAFLIAAPIVWFGWCVLFGVMAFRTNPERFAGRLYKSLLAGSVLELLIAIPMHMVVRQRGYCCAGFGTGMGIGIGLLVVLIALGPAVVFLFYRRYKQAYSRH